MSLYDEIQKIWFEIEPLLDSDEYSEYIQSLWIVAKYGNEEECKTLYEGILKEFQSAKLELVTNAPKEVPTFLYLTLKLGNKNAGTLLMMLMKKLLKMEPFFHLT